MSVQRVVGIADMAVSDRADDVLITYSLGSCIGLALYDPRAGVGGLMHAQMPLSKMDPAKAAERPLMFTDTAALALLRAIFELGASRQHLVAKVAGAATHLDPRELFRIGERNHVMLRKVLWKNDILIAAEDVGGVASRTMHLEVASGATYVKANGRTFELKAREPRGHPERGGVKRGAERVAG